MAAGLPRLEQKATSQSGQTSTTLHPSPRPPSQLMKEGQSTWRSIPRDDGSPLLDTTEPSSSGASTTSRLIRTILTRSLIASSPLRKGESYRSPSAATETRLHQLGM